MLSKRSLISVLVITAALTGCRLVIDSGIEITGSGYVTTEYRTLGDFNQVQMNGIGNIQIKKGYTPSVTVEADENIQSYIVTYVSNRVLVISVRNGYNLHPSGHIHYTVVTPQIKSYTLNGAGNAWINGIDTTAFALTLNGSGDITADGLCDDLDVDLNGAGNIDASDLCADYAYANITGSGNITVWSMYYLNAIISGNGNINYYGDPDVDHSITGYGSVNWMGY